MSENKNLIKGKSVAKKKSNADCRVLGEGVEFSADSRKTGMNNNVMLLGVTGSGKTTGFVVPNIQKAVNSLVVSDTKSRLYKQYKTMLEEKGYDVKLLDLVNPKQSCRYNPLAHIRRYEDGSLREQDVLTLADSLIMCCKDDREPVWHLSARAFIAFLICYCLEEMPEEEQNLGTICELNHSFSKPNGELAFLDWIRSHPWSFAAKKYMELKANMPADRMWASILGFVNVALESFEFREAEYIFGAGEGIDLRDLGRKKTALFLNVSDTDRSMDAMVNIFYTQTLQLLCQEADLQPDGRLQVPVHIMMDDFATSAKIKQMDSIISVVRSREISISLILQSISQLRSIYGDAANTILENCDHILMMGTQDTETAEFIGARAFKTPEKILCMPRDYAYMLESGKEAKLIKKIRPFKFECE